MRHLRGLALAMGSTLALALACGNGEDTRDVSAEDVREETVEALESAAGYAGSKRQELRERTQRALRDLERELSAASEALAEEGDEHLTEAVERAEHARDAGAEELERLERTTADGWETARERLSHALGEIAEARREVAAALRGEQEG